MSLEKYLDVTPEIAEALASGKPVVGLESTILSHGMPYPQNMEFAAKVEEIVRAKGAIPATTAIIGGKLKVGLTHDELMMMCNPKDIGKVSRRDVAVYLATGKTGATTVTTTMMICAMAGIKVFATGGIGGVHRHGETTMDISADLQELANTPVCVISAGAKSLLDLGRTLEYLETFGVPVLGYKTDEFPAFYCKSSGYKLDYRCESAEEIAKIIYTKWDLGLKGGAIVGNPIPDEFALDYDEMEKVISAAIKEADENGVRGKAITPFLLSRIKDMTEGVSFASNLELAYNNARLASDVAVELEKLYKN
ncbi:MAG: pseudouridine-5'-phosphate glycosidase [Oscillospiraceae bacterium]|nr:pseudouridine-5'-phosphate glycosidase [Oscillospiraceae bacterium]